MLASEFRANLQTFFDHEKIMVCFFCCEAEPRKKAAKRAIDGKIRNKSERFFSLSFFMVPKVNADDVNRR